MAANFCPKCKEPGRYLAATSETAMVDYYRCDECGHVWTIDKRGGRRDVTQPSFKSDHDPITGKP